MMEEKSRKTGRSAFISPEIEPYRQTLELYTLDDLKLIYRTLGFPPWKKKKTDLVLEILSFLSFEGKEAVFQAWFDSLPRYLSRAIGEAAFQGFVPAATLEPLVDQPIVVKDKRSYYYYGDFEHLNPELRLDLFSLYQNYEQRLLFMKEPFRDICSRWLPKPEGYTAGPVGEDLHPGWDAAGTLSESMPLLLEALSEIFESDERLDKVLRRGLNKTDIKNLRRVSAYPEFPEAGKLGADPINLIARFMLIDPKASHFTRKKDIRDHVRSLITAFLDVPSSGRVVSYYYHLGSNYEFSALAVWITRKPGSGRYLNFMPFPPSRIIFRQILRKVAGSGSWFSLDDLTESLRLQGAFFHFCNDRSYINEIYLKGDDLSLPEGAVHSDRWDPLFFPDPFLEHSLIVKPLLKAYCYLMASLGVLQIREERPDTPVKLRGKDVPISPYDGLTHIRTTPFGAWCLGFSAEKPELAAVEYEAIADSELLLVTYRGSSQECRAFLELVGTPLGEERFRITEGSFIRGCNDPAEIEKRIETFHRLICPEPAGHWLELFTRVRQGAALFLPAEECVMVQLPANPDLRRLFIDDPKIARLVTRAEGGRIVVRSGDYKKLRKALEGYGFLDW